MTLLPSIPGLEVRATASTEEHLAARRLHATCYVDAGYVSDDDLDDHGFITDAWVPFSDYYVAIDQSDGTLVGTCRIIRPSVCGFPVFHTPGVLDTALQVFADLDPNLCVEISALATRREGMQNTAISAALYGIVWQYALRNRSAYLLAYMDNRLLRIMRRWFHFPFEPTGPSTVYMGSESTPVALYVPRTISEARREHPDTLAFFSGDIPFAEINDVEVDLRERAPELRSDVIDLRSSASRSV